MHLMIQSPQTPSEVGIFADEETRLRIAGQWNTKEVTFGLAFHDILPMYQSSWPCLADCGGHASQIV